MLNKRVNFHVQTFGTFDDVFAFVSLSDVACFIVSV